MTNHTPEPWATEERGIIYSLHPDWRGPWAINLGDSGRNFTRELDEANARRVCACINACKDIETKKLEKHWPNGGLLPCVEIHEAAEKAEQYKKQRDDLLAALLSVVYKNDDGEYTSCFIEDAVLNEYVQEAIEACTGKQP